MLEYIVAHPLKANFVVATCLAMPILIGIGLLVKYSPNRAKSLSKMFRRTVEAITLWWILSIALICLFPKKSNICFVNGSNATERAIVLGALFETKHEIGPSGMLNVEIYGFGHTDIRFSETMATLDSGTYIVNLSDKKVDYEVVLYADKDIAEHMSSLYLHSNREYGLGKGVHKIVGHAKTNIYIDGQNAPSNIYANDNMSYYIIRWSK
ncbi:MAG: hypothetical protein EOM25_09810 [Deltaproteobacteria bacterium]|nr:hypothetical protein [Deltaproteobacteria bacterium]